MRRSQRLTARPRGRPRRCTETDTRVNVSSTRLNCLTSECAVSMSEQPLRVGVVGLGYWGPNLARNFSAISGCEVVYLCDADPSARERLAQSFPGAIPTGDLGELLDDPSLDAVVLATPVPTHAELAIRTLDA